MDKEAIDVIALIDKKINYHIGQAQYYKKMRQNIETLIINADAEKNKLNDASAENATDVKYPTGEFSGMTQLTAVKNCILARTEKGLPPPKPSDLRNDLLDGGYTFQRDGKEQQMNSIRTLLSRNRGTIFGRLKDGGVILVEKTKEPDE